MAQALAVLALIRKLMSKELSSVSSLGLNNFIFLILFLMAGGTAKQAFWSTLLFQLLLLVPLLVTFSVETQQRLPSPRVGIWPLTNKTLLLLSIISFTLNPLFLVLFVVFFAWMGIAIALSFLLLGLVIHAAVYGIRHLIAHTGSLPRLRVPRPPSRFGGIAQCTWRELTATLDFWTALLLAICGALYRTLKHHPEPEAFPILSLFVGIAISTVAQRMVSLDEGRTLLRLRLLPLEGWKLLLTQDLSFLFCLAILVAPLNLRTGIAFGLIALAVGRYPSLVQRVVQRRGRFVGGDLRFGLAQVFLGSIAGVEAGRHGIWVVAVTALLYLASLFWGMILWKRLVIA